MRRHYEAILHQIPFAGEEDDLAARFPLMRPPSPLPSMSPRSLRVLNAYEKHKSRLNDRGITVGKARLALNAKVHSMRDVHDWLSVRTDLFCRSDI